MTPILTGRDRVRVGRGGATRRVASAAQVERADYAFAECVGSSGSGAAGIAAVAGEKLPGRPRGFKEGRASRPPGGGEPPPDRPRRSGGRSVDESTRGSTGRSNWFGRRAHRPSREFEKRSALWPFPGQGRIRTSTGFRQSYQCVSFSGWDATTGEPGARGAKIVAARWPRSSCGACRRSEVGEPVAGHWPPGPSVRESPKNNFHSDALQLSYRPSRIGLTGVEPATSTS